MDTNVSWEIQYTGKEFTTMKRMRLTLLISSVITSVLLVYGCSSSTDGGSLPLQSVSAPLDQETIERDSVLEAVSTLQTEGFESAFKHLADYDYTRYIRTEQFDDSDFMVAFRERTIRHAGEPDTRTYTLLSSDSTGSYDFGYFRRFVSDNVDEQDPEDLTPYLFPEDPAYLSSRNFEAYAYTFEEDSLMLNITAQAVEIRAKPEDGDGKNIRRARYFINPKRNELVAFELERIDLAFFFREESTFFVHVQTLADGTVVPYNTRFETRIIVPFRDPQRFRTVASYYNVSERD